MHTILAGVSAVFKLSFHLRYIKMRYLHISYNTPGLPPKSLNNLRFFNVSWVLQSPQEELKTMPMQTFGGQTRCIMGDVQNNGECSWLF